MADRQDDWRAGALTEIEFQFGKEFVRKLENESDAHVSGCLTVVRQARADAVEEHRRKAEEYDRLTGRTEFVEREMNAWKHLFRTDEEHGARDPRADEAAEVELDPHAAFVERENNAWKTLFRTDADAKDK